MRLRAAVLTRQPGTMIVMSAWLMVGVVDFALTLGLEWDRTLSGTPIQQIIQGAAPFTACVMRPC